MNLVVGLLLSESNLGQNQNVSNTHSFHKSPIATYYILSSWIRARPHGTEFCVAFNLKTCLF